MLFLLIACLRITDEERSEWKSLYSPKEEEKIEEPYFSVAANISPTTNIFVGTELVCSATALDQNEEEIFPSYHWMNGEEELGVDENYIVLGEEAEVGASITCVATILGLSGQDISSQDSVIVENTEPALSDVEISPAAPIYNDDTLTCTTTVEDPNEEVVIEYAWENNSVQIEVGDSIDLSAHTVLPNQSISCVVNVVDSQGGEDTDSASVSIVNRPPIVDSVEISDHTPRANENITCLGSASDEDGEEPELHYSWEIDGNVVATGLDLALSPNFVDVGDSLDCVVTANDGFGGSDYSSDTATIQNTNPTITSINITPHFSINNSSLTCSAEGEDLNDGELSPSYVWKNGSTQIGTGNSLQLSLSIVSSNDVVRCIAEVTDNNGASASSSTSITIPTIF